MNTEEFRDMLETHSKWRLIVDEHPGHSSYPQIKQVPPHVGGLSKRYLASKMFA